jgi:hypothetical protein
MPNRADREGAGLARLVILDQDGKTTPGFRAHKTREGFAHGEDHDRRLPPANAGD